MSHALPIVMFNRVTAMRSAFLDFKVSFQTEETRQ